MTKFEQATIIIASLGLAATLVSSIVTAARHIGILEGRVDALNQTIQKMIENGNANPTYNSPNPKFSTIRLNLLRGQILFCFGRRSEKTGSRSIKSETEMAFDIDRSERNRTSLTPVGRGPRMAGSSVRLKKQSDDWASFSSKDKDRASLRLVPKVEAVTSCNLSARSI